MEDYRRWNSDPAYFAGKTSSFFFCFFFLKNSFRRRRYEWLSTVAGSSNEGTTTFRQRQRRFQTKIQTTNRSSNFPFFLIFFLLFFEYFQLRSRWQTRQHEVQLLSLRNSSAAEQQRQSVDIEFQREYEQLKQSASQERRRLNELHETHLDLALNSAKIDANKNLISAWNEQPLKVIFELHETQFDSIRFFRRKIFKKRFTIIFNCS